MGEHENLPDIKPIATTLQIIVGTMAVGASLFLIVGVFVEMEGGIDNTVPILSYVALGFSPVALSGSFILASVLTSSGCKRIARGESASNSVSLPGSLPPTDAGQLCGVFSTVTIIRAATLEGAALLLGAAYMVERETPVLVVAVIVIAVLATNVPTAARIRQWLDKQLRNIDETRMLNVR